MAEAHLAAKFNKPGFDMLTIILMPSMEMVVWWKVFLKKPLVLLVTLNLVSWFFLYDSNDISLDGPTSMAFTEDVKAKFEAYGWQHILVKDGNDLEAIAKDIEED